MPPKPLPAATLKPNQTKKTFIADTSGILLGDKVYWNPATFSRPKTFAIAKK